MGTNGTALHCQRLADELRSVAVACAGAEDADQLLATQLLRLEAAKLRPSGLTLAVSHTADGWMTVLLKQDTTQELWAAFEFLPDSGQFRRFSQLESYPRRAQRGRGAGAANLPGLGSVQPGSGT